jgi:hypothetical protein
VHQIIFQSAGSQISVFDVAKHSGTRYVATTNDGRAFVVSAFVAALYERLDSPTTARQLHTDLEVQLEFSSFNAQLNHLIHLGILCENRSKLALFKVKTPIVARWILFNERQLRMPSLRLRSLFLRRNAALWLIIIGIFKLLYLPPFVAFFGLSQTGLFSMSNTNLIQTALSFLEINPIYFFLFAGLMITLFLTHELGHAAACVHYEKRPGSIGIGLYYSLPVLFMDATTTWGLRRWQRVVVDLAGVYAQQILTTLIMLAFVIWRLDVLLAVVLASDLICLFNLLPLGKFDGYWACNDALGRIDLACDGRKWLVALMHGTPQPKPDVFTVLFGLLHIAVAVGLCAYLISSWRLLFQSISGLGTVVVKMLTGHGLTVRGLIIMLTFVPTLIYLLTLVRSSILNLSKRHNIMHGAQHD